MYRVSESRVSESDILSITSTTLPICRYPWRVELFPQGKIWNIGAQNTPIESLNFDLAEKGCMNAKIKYATIDFPVYYGNEVNIYYNGVKRYRGYISTLPDPKGDTINITPYSKRFDEVRFNTTWSNYSFLEMLHEVIVDKTTDTNVYYNPTMVTDYNSTYVYGSTGSIKYKYEKVNKLLDDYINKVDDVYYGVQEDGFLYIKKRSTSINHYLYSGSNQAFQEIKPKKDYAKIKETRYDIFQKSTVTNENEYIATIPDGTSNYPYSDNEAIVGIKYNHLTAPEGLNSTECKDYAYAKIAAQKAPENTKITGIDIRRYDLKIGERVKIYSEPERQLYDLLNCDSTVGWTGNMSIDNVDYIEGTGSILVNMYAYNSIRYDFGSIQRYLNIEKITMMIKTNTIGNNINFEYGQNITGYGNGNYGMNKYSIGTTVYSEEMSYTNIENISIPNVNVWCLVEIPVTKDFRYIGIKNNSSKTMTINIDNIKLYGYFQQSYEGNVIKLGYDIDSDKEYLYNAEIGDYDEKANDLLFAMQKKLESMETGLQE